MSTFRSIRLAKPQFFRALPAYLGGKRRLRPLIFSLVAEQFPRTAWSGATFLDPFSGGGAASLYAKAQGFAVTASDLAERAAIVGRALIANSCVRLRHADVLDLFLEPSQPYAHTAAANVPDVLIPDQAAWLDGAVARAARRAEPVHSLLLLVAVRVALGCQPMSLLTASDARAAASGDLDHVSPRRLGHYPRAAGRLAPEAVWRGADGVNGGVFGGAGRAPCGDALDVIARADAGVLYLDPPYAGTSRYEREYAVARRAARRSRATRASAAHARRAARRGAQRAAGRALVRRPERHARGPRSAGRTPPRRAARARRALPHLCLIASKELNDVNREHLVAAGR